MVENTDTKSDETKQSEQSIPKYSRKKIAVYVCITVIALTVGFIHYKYVANLFDNDRNFAFLSDLEREMSLRTEMGFYYSYYKTVVEERPFLNGISKIMYDKLVEYPNEVNAFNRFNINPEVIIGAMYRYFEPWINTTYKECDMIERGEGHSPVQSCVGIGQPIYFYLEAIWWLAGLTVAVLFLHACILSESIFGGIIAILQYFANHAECTRVQWAPNERENFAIPFLLLQTCLLTVQLRQPDKSKALKLQVAIFITNCLCLLFWQFTQFIFLTQIAIFFVMEQLRIIDTKTLSIFLHSHFCGLHTAILLLQGNDMLKSSLYTSFFGIISMYCLFFSSFRINIKNRLDLFAETWLVLLRILLAVTSSLYLKKSICNYLGVKDDSHVYEILFSKFTDYKSFNTLIYTCSDVFDYLPTSSIINMTKTLLIPITLLSGVNMVCFWVSDAIFKCKKEIEDLGKEKEEEDGEDDDSGIENNSESNKNRSASRDLDVMTKLQSNMQKRKEIKDLPTSMFILKNLNVEPAIFYNFSQLVVFGIMAGLVMRLKLLFSTQMCLICSLIANKNYNIFPKSISKYAPMLWALAIFPLLQELYRNVSHELSHIGEFNDFPQEQLLQWISKEPGVGAFAGSMPISSSIMLSTRRPIVTHPHYEHVEARKRAFTVYKMYGRFSSRELYMELNELRATYLIVETNYCYGKSKKGCSFENIWDIQYPKWKSRPKLCHKLLTEPVEHFYPVFRNSQYAVFRLHDISVRYTPRSYDT